MDTPRYLISGINNFNLNIFYCKIYTNNNNNNFLKLSSFSFFTDFYLELSNDLSIDLTYHYFHFLNLTYLNFSYYYLHFLNLF